VLDNLIVAAGVEAGGLGVHADAPDKPVVRYVGLLACALCQIPDFYLAVA